MFMRITTAAFVVASSLYAIGAQAQPPATTSNGVLVDAKGMTLYTFDKDQANSGKSVCNDQCATNWPPLMADANAKVEGNWSIITRDDGTRQWAYQGKPVYLFIKDTKAGDQVGDGVKDVWHVIKP